MTLVSTPHNLHDSSLYIGGVTTNLTKSRELSYSDSSQSQNSSLLVNLATQKHEHQETAIQSAGTAIVIQTDKPSKARVYKVCNVLHDTVPLTEYSRISAQYQMCNPSERVMLTQN